MFQYPWHLRTQTWLTSSYWSKSTIASIKNPGTIAIHPISPRATSNEILISINIHRFPCKILLVTNFRTLSITEVPPLETRSWPGTLSTAGNWTSTKCNNLVSRWTSLSQLLNIRGSGPHPITGQSQAIDLRWRTLTLASQAAWSCQWSKTSQQSAESPLKWTSFRWASSKSIRQVLLSRMQILVSTSRRAVQTKTNITKPLKETSNLLRLLSLTSKCVRTISKLMWRFVLFITSWSVKNAVIYLTIGTIITKFYCLKPPLKTSFKISIRSSTK